jgi:uncharacterized protein YjbI with pentapeptide repeats
MANPEHLEILKLGVEVWNKWWKEKLVKHDIDLSNATLESANLNNAIFSFANLNGADLSNAQLKGAVFDLALLNDSNLNSANLDQADFWGAILERANLKGAHLNGSFIKNAHLTMANLEGASFVEANLSGTSLVGAQLTDTDLINARLFGTKLSQADLKRAKLHGALLYGVNFNGSDLTNAELGFTTFSNCDLSEAKGLETVRHVNPSSIGIDTIFHSKNRIPEVFLGGCGLPEAFITQIPSLLASMDPLHFHSCFISYSHKDKYFAKHLHSRMRAANLRVWYAPEEMKGGQKIHEQIYSAIQVHDKLLLVLSENSLQSEWVMTEIRRARKVEREQNRRKLFPIRLVDLEAIQKWECFDAESGKDLAIELREYFIPDFSNWKNRLAFEAAFDRLLRDLKAEDKKP